jgi:flagellar hook protein FlgE
MLTSLYSGVSGMQQFQQSMDVIGNNIANVNTTGFKSARVDFADSFSAAMGETGAGNSMQIGTGVTTSAISNNFTRGTVTSTGVQTDVAIEGNGFFVVSDAANGAQFLTRAGDFKIDTNGYLVTNSGLRVQGFSDAGLTTRGDILIDGTGSSSPPGTAVASVSIDREGKIKVRMEDGVEFVRGQILLQNVRSPQNLVKEGNNLYSGMAYAGPLAQISVPGTSGLGRLVGSALEMSNVDLAGEFADLITTQRAFQANARIITTSDEMLMELVNLKR